MSRASAETSPHALSRNSDTALWRAVISQALTEASSPRPTGIIPAIEIRRARIWFEGNGEDFRHVCALADLEADRVRALALKKIEAAKNGAPPPPAPRKPDDVPPAPRKPDDVRLLEFGGKSQFSNAWAADLGIKPNAFCSRLQKYRAGKITYEEVFAPKPAKKEPKIAKPKPEKARYEFAGKALTAQQWAAELGWSVRFFQHKLSKHRAGMLSAEQVFVPKPVKQPQPEKQPKPEKQSKPKSAPSEVARYEYAGKLLTAKQWAAELKISSKAMWIRLSLLREGKISAEQAFGAKAAGTHHNAKRYSAFGESLTIGAWAMRLGIPKATLVYRLSAGHSIEDALTMPSQRRRTETNSEAATQ